jgi:hypothetical protein
VRDLESQGIKLSSVLSDVLGKSGYAMVKALLARDMSPEQIADLAVGKLRCKRAEIARAVQGKLDETARLTIGLKLELRETLDRQLQALDARIEQALAPMKQQVELLLEVPGLKHTVIAALLAEIGADKMLVTIYYMLRDGVPYRELGAGYTPAPNVPSRVRYHLQQLQQLGVDVSPLRTQAA